MSRLPELKRPAFGRVVVAGLTARRLMIQVRKIDMENTTDRNSSWADPLSLGAGQQVDRASRARRYDARMEDGFTSLLACEDDAKPPTARYTIAANGVAYPEEV